MEKNKQNKQSESIFSFFKSEPSKSESKPESKAQNNDEDKSLWVPDDQADTCFNCGKKFMSLFLRRHHCRICGNIFCKDCYIKFFKVDQEKESKACEYCQEMHKRLVKILGESLVEYRDPKDNSKSFVTKLFDYVKNDKNNKEKIKKFIGLQENDKNTMYDKKINEIYLMFAKETIGKILKSSEKYPNLYEEWGELITKLTLEAVDNVSPSFQDLKDSIDINEYIKIKTISYSDKSLSRVIDGYAFQKNVCTKKMKTKIENPSILLLDCGLDSKRNDSIQMPNILTQEPAYLEILRKKIEAIRPKVIVVNKNASHKLQEEFNSDKMDISLVINVKSSSLQKIARCTKTYVLPSADLVNKETLLGNCALFHVEKIKTFQGKDSSKQNLIKTNEYNLMIFEGCGSLLYNTILLSGRDKEELKEIKRLMKTSILKSIRDLHLQKYLLKYFNVDIFQATDNTNSNGLIDDDSQRNSNEILISTEKDKNDEIISTSIANKLNDINKENDLKQMKSINDFAYGFDRQILNDSNISFKLTQLAMIKGKTFSFDVTNQSIGGRNTTYANSNEISSNQGQPTKESEILKSVPQVCGVPLDVTMKFYSSDFEEEKPLGKLIIDLCQQKDEKCPTCSRPQNDHLYFLYKIRGRIRVSMIGRNDDVLDNMLSYLNIDYNTQGYQMVNQMNVDQLDIYSYGYCEECKAVVTPLIKLPKEIVNFSASKFYKHILFNHMIKNYNRSEEYNIKEKYEQSCDHYLYKTISRIFITKIGSVKFSYDSITKYVFVDSKINLDSNVMEVVNKKIVDAVILNIKGISIDVLGNIKEWHTKQLKALDEITSTLLTEQVSKVKEIINTNLTFINELSKIIEEFKPEYFDSILKLNVSTKTLYLKIVQIKMMSNMITKIITKINNVIFIENINNNFLSSSTKVQKEASTSKKNSINEQPQQVQEEQKKENEEKKENLILPEKSELKENQSLHLNTISENIDLFLNPDEQIDIDHPSIQEEIKKKNNADKENLKEIYKIDNSDSYKKILSFLDFYDTNHTKYSVEVHEGDICSLIAHLLTSDKYLEHINSGSKFNLNEVKRVQKENNQNADSDLYKTALLFDQESVRYISDKVEEETVRQQLETELLSDEKASFCLPIQFDFSKLVNDLFADPKGRNAENENLLKINFTDMLYQFKKTKDDLDVIKSEIKNVKNTNYADIKSRFKFVKIKYVEENQTAIEGSITAYYPKQFEAIRILYCSSYDNFIMSIAKSNVWSTVSGGKSKANFYKTDDNRYIIKCITKNEFKMFLESVFHYFHHTNKFLFHKMPSALSKTIGAFKVKIRTPKKETNYCVIMENLYYNIVNPNTPFKAYDLKGSRLNRYIPKVEREGKVLMDTNFLEDFAGNPLALDKRIYTLLKVALQNDCLILSKMNVVDYSLLLILCEEPVSLSISKNNSGNVIQEEDDEGKIMYIRVAIIDYFRKYTWDKQLENLGKTIMHKFSKPTIVNPGDYKKRFLEKIINYFIGI